MTFFRTSERDLFSGILVNTTILSMIPFVKLLYHVIILRNLR